MKHDAQFTKDARELLADIALAAGAAGRDVPREPLDLNAIEGEWAMQAATYARQQVTPLYRGDEVPTSYEKGQIHTVAAAFRDGYFAAIEAVRHSAAPLARSERTRLQNTEETKNGDVSRVAPSIPCVAPAGSTAEPPPSAVTAAERTEPPFNGEPCPMCPVEIRNLAAVAHNLLAVWDDPNRRFKLERRIEQLRAAVALVEPLSEAHFADRAHSHGDK